MPVIGSVSGSGTVRETPRIHPTKMTLVSRVTTSACRANDNGKKSVYMSETEMIKILQN